MSLQRLYKTALKDLVLFLVQMRGSQTHHFSAVKVYMRYEKNKNFSVIPKFPKSWKDRAPYSLQKNLKDTTSVPIFFYIFGENFTVINYLYNNSPGNSIFLDRKTIFCCWELIFAVENQFKPVFLVINYLKF